MIWFFIHFRTNRKFISFIFINRFRIINLENQLESALDKDINNIINLEYINFLDKELINKICQIYKEKNEYFRFVKFH